MKFYCCWLIVTTVLAWHGPDASVASAADVTRQHEAHVHGAGTLNLVQEGKQLHIELDIPGMDIVGFEHKARTAAQKQTVKDAVAALQQGSNVFRINSEAECAFDSAEVEVTLMDEDHDGDHDDKDDHKPEAATAHQDHDNHGREPNKAMAQHDHKDEHKSEKPGSHDKDREESHSEFHAKYVFTCAVPGKLRQINIGLFDTFKGSESLQAQVVTERKQGAQRLTREAPVIQLK